LCCDYVFLASYLWDPYEIEVDVLTARMESHGILMTQSRGMEIFRSRVHSQKTTIVYTVNHSLSE